jgi:hypothetical protein
LTSSLLCEEGLKHKDLWLASLLNDKAVLYSNIKHNGSSRFDEAKREFKECIQLLKSISGRNSQCILMVYNNFGCLAEKMGKFRSAKIIFEKVIRQQYKSIGPGHPDTIICKNNLACMLLQSCERSTAEIEELFEDCLATRESESDLVKK